MIHQLKIDTRYFEMKAKGIKKWEIRDNDRGFMVGDYLGLNETVDGKETGRFLIEKIVAVIDNASGLRDGYVLLSTEEAGFWSAPKGLLDPPFGERNRIKE